MTSKLLQRKAFSHALRGHICFQHNDVVIKAGKSVNVTYMVLDQIGAIVTIRREGKQQKETIGAHCLILKERPATQTQPVQTSLFGESEVAQ